ncbi:MAG: dicarboxylate/amino acid:cation symporter, partial [Holosporaceae bacterium]|nr:dicarboxylate/amino acid:cation symporter [Holosporaceae bacterium]
MLSDGFFNKKISMNNRGMLYLIAIILGCVCGYCGILQPTANFISNAFIKIFKCMSLPIIVVSVIVSLSQDSQSVRLKQIGKQALFYTMGTTVAASLTACILYMLISPSNITSAAGGVAHRAIEDGKYVNYLLDIIPSNILSPFLEHNVMGALAMSIIIGIAIRCMPSNESRSLHNFFRMIQGMFLIIIGWVVKALPLALFGFVSSAAVQLKSGVDVKGLGGYLSVVILSNVIQGIIVL